MSKCGILEDEWSSYLSVASLACKLWATIEKLCPSWVLAYIDTRAHDNRHTCKHTYTNAEDEGLLYVLVFTHSRWSWQISGAASPARIEVGGGWFAALHSCTSIAVERAAASSGLSVASKRARLFPSSAGAWFCSDLLLMPSSDLPQQSHAVKTL